VSWHFDPRWQLDVLFPRNAEILYEASERVTLHAGFDAEAEECHLRHTATGALTETDVRVHEIYGFLGAICRAGRNLSASIRVGTRVCGAYDWDDGGPTDYDGDLEPGAFQLLGIAWDF